MKNDHTYLSCSNCNAILADLVKTVADESIKWKFRAKCPFCGDKSYVKELTGIFAVGGVGRPKPDDPTDDIPSTAWDNQETIDGITWLTMVKARANAQPQYQV